MPFQFKLNLDSELMRLLGDYELIIPTCVLSEARGLANSEKFGKSALKLALSKTQPDWFQEIEPEIPDIDSNKSEPSTTFEVDKRILDIAIKLNAIVVTNDKEFLKQLKAAGVQTISLRGRKYLKLN
jgi:rRNA-processing protein FCF1